MDKFMVIFTTLGNMGTVWIVIALLLILGKKYRRIGFMVLIAMLLGTILGDGIVKHVVMRIRPSESIPIDKLLIPKPLSYSFPSGHTTSSFAAAGILCRYFKKYAALFLILAFLIAFSRLYLYVHYPTDVLGGVILGLLCSRIAVELFQRLRKKDQ